MWPSAARCGYCQKAISKSQLSRHRRRPRLLYREVCIRGCLRPSPAGTAKAKDNRLMVSFASGAAASGAAASSAPVIARDASPLDQPLAAVAYMEVTTTPTGAGSVLAHQLAPTLASDGGFPVAPDAGEGPARPVDAATAVPADAVEQERAHFTESRYCIAVSPPCTEDARGQPVSLHGQRAGPARVTRSVK
ncbi:uncharacterized protein LOC122364257 isoform X1 [Amphibalanus amphitrite]|uniref:uncharacterized protein LOC122364257 isoform X1 n=1 Tax=Amphibalanus amphitrite TaxID=1232801 RepID=UPI001C9112A9|nr:uncharacterized protein LOC122364257 isoform X1 [Amphibalanus amphitrite]